MTHSPSARSVAQAVCAVLLVSVVTAPAMAEETPDGKRAVAVLEYRSGSSALPHVGPRLAAILQKKTSLGIIDVDDARRLIGRDIDRRVARCTGQARCIARLGKALKAREVLLIGVSRFGDEIITLQRIDVDAAKVLTRIADVVARGEQPGNDALLSYLKKVLPKSDFLRYGTIRIEADLQEATVAVNGKKIGRTPLKPLRVRAPANYSIRITKAGYNPFSASVHVPPDGTVRVDTPLARRVHTPWYKRWWVVALAGGAVVGTVSALALTRDGADELPVTIRF